MRSKIYFYYAIVCIVLWMAGAASAQTTEFTYQGKLTDSAGTAASYDFEFRLFSVETGGAALATNQRPGVSVSGNIFTVRLDFGANLDGQSRWLEIAVKPAGSANPFSVLNPRQPITSAPYAIRSLNAASSDISTDSTLLGGVAASQFVQTGDTRLTDARPPTPGSNNYIQNSLLQQQTNANFNIAGSGRAGSLTAEIVSALTQFNIGNSRVLSTPGTRNLFAGASAGFANTSGADNSFFGRDAGQSNNLGSRNAFFGSDAGASNTTGDNNSFFGKGTGQANTAGSFNSFFGRDAGFLNTASNNSFFGATAGMTNTTGDFNSFIGIGAGQMNTVGSQNTGLGAYAGDSNTTGNNNTFVGSFAGSANTTGIANTFFGKSAGTINTTGDSNTVIGSFANVFSGDLTHATAIGADSFVNTSNTIALGRNDGSDKVVIYGLGLAGATALCRNATSQISSCSSSLRYKTNITPFNSGLNLVNRLRPISFDWKEGGMHDLGLGAEDVEKIEPLLVTYNKDGQVEGVKYDRIGVVLLNAVKEQQAQIESQLENARKQQKQIEKQQIIIDGLRKIVCSQNPTADICKEPKQ
jgi:hypothetical protein